MERKDNQTSQINNLEIYNKVKSVPDNAVKSIEAGRLKGKSDINPMWRIKKLTELFGPVGFGWYTEIANRWEETCESGEVAVFVEINLYVKKDGEWSKPIHGTGGNKVVSMEKKWVNGEQTAVAYLDDDSYKKAYTDAISVAAKALGIGADVYWNADKGKYTQTPVESPAVVSEEVTEQAQLVAQKIFAKKPSLTPKNILYWRQAVAFTASQPDDRESLEKRIRSKYEITDEDLQNLMHQAGKDNQ